MIHNFDESSGDIYIGHFLDETIDSSVASQVQSFHSTYAKFAVEDINNRIFPKLLEGFQFFFLVRDN